MYATLEQVNKHLDDRVPRVVADLLLQSKQSMIEELSLKLREQKPAPVSTTKDAPDFTVSILQLTE